MTDTEERQARLEARLRDGFLKIGEAMNRGVEVENWERHFVMLVREYEAISDVLRNEPPVQVEMGLNARMAERDAA